MASIIQMVVIISATHIACSVSESARFQLSHTISFCYTVPHDGIETHVGIGWVGMAGELIKPSEFVRLDHCKPVSPAAAQMMWGVGGWGEKMERGGYYSHGTNSHDHRLRLRQIQTNLPR